MDYNKALELLEKGKIEDCENYFLENNFNLEYGYCELLKENLVKAEEIFSKEKSVRSDWALKLIYFFQGRNDYLPTYFQIRNFLEIDIDLLLKSGRKKMVDYIISYSDFFQDINNETYKFLGRVMLKNDYPDISKKYLDKYKDTYYKDPELHYLYVEYYLYMKDYKNALKSADNCLSVNSNYYPAKKIKEKLACYNSF